MIPLLQVPIGWYARTVEDTSSKAHRRYFELLRAQSPAQRLETCARLSSATRELALAGLKAELPGASEQTLRAALARRLYGARIAERFAG